MSNDASNSKSHPSGNHPPTVNQSPEAPAALARYLQNARHSILGLSWAARVCLAVWAAIGLFSLYQFVGDTASAARMLSVDEQTRRSTTWAPIYSFGQTCASRLLPHGRLVLIDPTGLQSSSTSPSAPSASVAYGQAPDVDVFNAPPFAYPVYPRDVALLGHAPTQQDMQLLAPDYWAVWRQTAFRSTSAQSEASSAKRSLAALLGGQEVCAYTDAEGNKGDIFAASPGARAFLAAGGAATLSASPNQNEARVVGPFDSWGAYGRALLGLASLWVIGALVLRLILARTVLWSVIAALALPVGGLLAAVEMLLFSLTQTPWSAPLLALPWLLLGTAGVCGFFIRHWRTGLPRPSREMITRLRPRLALDEYLALAVLAVIVLGVVVVSTIQLPYSDGFQIYYFKALAYFADQNAASYYATAGSLSYTIPAHPPLIPLDITWLYLFIGRVDEHSSLLLWPALWISLLATAFLFARAVSTRRIAIWVTLSLALFGMVTSSAERGSFTDMPLAVYITALCFVTLFWAAWHRHAIRLGVIAGLLLGGVALTKEEGYFVALVVVVTLAALIALPWLARRQSWSDIAPQFLFLGVVVAVGLLTVLPWLVMRWSHPIPELLVGHSNASLVALVGRVGLALAGLALRALVYWLPGIVLLVIWLVERRRTGARLNAVPLTALVFLGAVILLQLVADAAGMAANTSAISDEIAHTATRLLMQLTPLVFVISALLWLDLLRQKRETVEAGGSAQRGEAFLAARRFGAS